MKPILVILTLLGSGGALALWSWSDARGQRVAFRTVAVARGDLQTAIHATGTIEPEEVVDVGVQVAGEIQSFGADTARPEQADQLRLAGGAGDGAGPLDDALFRARVSQARARLARAEATCSRRRPS
jgi:HlyD family secretion protein